MGYYINPPDMEKEDFLRQHGRPIHSTEAKMHLTDTTLPVCLVNNGGFTAAGIAYSMDEVDAFLHPDRRPKRWFSVSREALKPYYNEA